MKLAWLNGSERIRFDRPYVWLTMGVRGAGKSSFLEHLAELHLEHGNCVLDLFGSRSGENLAWLRSDWAKEKRILLLCDENAIVECQTADVKPYTRLRLEDFSDYDLIINSSPLYRSLDAEYEACNFIIDKLWHRLHWRRMVFTICREAASLMYSRLKVVESQQAAKAFLIYWLRESRHVGCSLGLDSVRMTSLDVDVRSLADFNVFKAQGAGGLPRELWFIYRHIEPAFLQHMRPHQLVILTRRGHIAVGVFPYPAWHKEEGEDILSKLNIRVQFEEQPLEGKEHGRYKTVGDQEHAMIIAAYIEQPYGMIKLAPLLHRSPTTINNAVKLHNSSLERIGYCPPCRRAKGPYAEQPAKKMLKEVTHTSIYSVPGLLPGEGQGGNMDLDANSLVGKDIKRLNS
jgi:hypothetical protein